MIRKYIIFFLVPLCLLVCSVNSVHSTNKVKITQLGYASCKIEFDSTTIYVDLASEVIDTSNLQAYTDADIILITHDDWDHFAPKWITEISKRSNSLIIGPPSITYPLLAENNLKTGQLEVFYPTTTDEYQETAVNDINIRIYQTNHFNEWSPIHVSFLVEYQETKIFISGDSYSYLEDKLINDKIDILLANMVEGNENVNNYISLYKQIDNHISYKYLLPCHLINCDFTISPLLFKKEISNIGVDNVVVLQDENDVFIYK